MSLLQNMLSAMRNSRRVKLQREALSSSKANRDLAQASGLRSSELEGGDRPTGATDALTNYLKIDTAMRARYRDYDEMESYSDLHKAADVFADESTVPRDGDAKSIWFHSPDDQIAADANSWLEMVGAEDSIWTDMRSFCCMGNKYFEPLVHKDYGIAAKVSLNPASVRRLEDERGVLVGFIQDSTGAFEFDMAGVTKAMAAGQVPEVQGCKVFDQFGLIHVRNLTRDSSDMYGSSVFEGGRSSFRRVLLLEDSTLVTKLTKGVNRYAFFINTGAAANADRWQMLDRYVDRFKRRKFVDKDGKVRMGADTPGMSDDWFFPVTSEQDPTRVEQISGNDYQQMDPLLYFKQSMMRGVGVPPQRIGYSDDSDMGKMLLVGTDVSFARTIMRLQRSMRRGYNQMYWTHAMMRGIDADHEDFIFDARMEIPSHIFELARMELHSARIDVMTRYKEFAPMAWIWQKFCGMSETEATAMVKAFQDEKKMLATTDREIEMASLEAQASMEGGAEESIYVGGIPVLDNMKMSDKMKRLDERFDQVLLNDRKLARRANDLKHLMKDIQTTMRNVPRPRTR